LYCCEIENFHKPVVTPRAKKLDLILSSEKTVQKLRKVLFHLSIYSKKKKNFRQKNKQKFILAVVLKYKYLHQAYARTLEDFAVSLLIRQKEESLASDGARFEPINIFNVILLKLSITSC
jgi:hypothetical protein